MIANPAHLVGATSVVVTSPFDRPLHQLGLEIVVITCFVLTARHAIVNYRRGERYHLFQWLVIFFYGLLMEIIAFNFLHNYTHAQFTVQLYRSELPLYVPCVYLVLHYAGLKSVERLRLGLVPEALLVGLAICLLDVPFDITGVDAGWWTWSSSDPNLAYRWLGVPVTSYYWYLLFGAMFASLCRVLRGTIERRSLAVYVAAAPLVGVAIIVTGTLVFLPFHGLKALGVADGTIVAAHLAGCCALAAFVRAPDARPLPLPLLAIAVALPAWHIAVSLMLWRAGQLPDGSAKLTAIAFAAAGSLALAWGLPVRARLRQTGTPAEI